MIDATEDPYKILNGTIAYGKQGTKLVGTMPHITGTAREITLSADSGT